MNMFFNYIWEQTFDERFETRDISQVNWRMNSVLDVGHKMVIQYMLDVVDFIRLQKSYYKARYVLNMSYKLLWITEPILIKWFIIKVENNNDRFLNNSFFGQIRIVNLIAQKWTSLLHF